MRPPARWCAPAAPARRSRTARGEQEAESGFHEAGLHRDGHAATFVPRFGAAPTLAAMLVLGIESSCDETGVALVEVGGAGAAAPGWRTRCTARSSMHQAYGGVVPELASRDHIRRVLPLTQTVLAAGRPQAGRRRRGGLHARPRPGRRAAGGRRRGLRAGRGAGQAGAGRAPPRRPPAVALPERRPAGVSLRRAAGVRRPHAADAGGRRRPLRAAGRNHRRRRRRSLRQDAPS